MWDSYDDFFKQATGHRPFDYQRKLALEPDIPELLRLPTGTGKTAAVVVAWLWRRKGQPDIRARSATPRRLVFCLPMRVLVEQTFKAVKSYVRNLGLDGNGGPSGSDSGVAVRVVMGGAVDDDWVIHPEQDQIVIGTQDMLLSRALNRGYGMSQFRWPMAFGLLNNDTLWVFDEIQLMGNGLYTSAQLDQFRNQLGTFGSTRSIWMSATAGAGWLATIDRQAPRGDRILVLGERDREDEKLSERLKARKIVRFSRIKLNIRGKEEEEQKEQKAEYYQRVASLLKDKHVKGTLTVAVFNTVERSCGVYKALCHLGTKAEVVLIHSRFRAAERKQLEERVTAGVSPDGPGRIVIATQVIEAGLDISARTLFTELAPWASIVQRLGRLNRYGEYDDSCSYWADLSRNVSAPYEEEALDLARKALQDLEGKSAAPASLPEIEMGYKPTYGLRRKDFNELFDTTPDISGYHIDVSRFVRGTEDPDAQVFWRTWKGDRPGEDVSLPNREELCAVPAWELKSYARRRTVWLWDHLESTWSTVRPEQIHPGQVFLLAAQDGGYSPTIGWDPDSGETVNVVDLGSRTQPEGIRDDPSTYRSSNWVSLSEHAENVVQEITTLLRFLGGILPEELAGKLVLAARYHDAGKAHPVFQERLLKGLSEAERQRRSVTIWAKSPTADRPGAEKHERGNMSTNASIQVTPGDKSRRYFRHELASALAVLSAINDPLVAYLVAAHHGKVRGVIRSVPGENLARDKRFALGVCEGDSLPEVDLGGGVVLKAVTLNLEAMEMGLTSSGSPSWVEHVSRFLKDLSLGPIRLAFLEALLRAADWLASAAEEREEAAQ